MLAFAVTARSWFAARSDGRSRIDGTDSRPLWFRGALRFVLRKEQESCDAKARVSTEQTRIVSVLAGLPRSGIRFASEPGGALRV